jgi:hypothetical protein
MAKFESSTVRPRLGVEPIPLWFPFACVDLSKALQIRIKRAQTSKITKVPKIGGLLFVRGKVKNLYSILVISATKLLFR